LIDGLLDIVVAIAHVGLQGEEELARLCDTRVVSDGIEVRREAFADADEVVTQGNLDIFGCKHQRPWTTRSRCEKDRRPSDSYEIGATPDRRRMAGNEFEFSLRVSFVLACGVCAVRGISKR
jgi:hypothetical protein